MTAIVVTSDGLNLYRNGTGGADNPLISYVALGTSNTAPTVNDHQLGNEVLRKAVTSYVDGITGEITVVMYLADGEGVGLTIAEIGFFGGRTATASPNTGILFAHGLYSLTGKTDLEAVQFQLDLKIVQSA